MELVIAVWEIRSFKQWAVGDHDFSLIFVLFVKFLCLTSNARVEPSQPSTYGNRFDFAAVRPKLQPIGAFCVCLKTTQYSGANPCSR